MYPQPQQQQQLVPFTNLQHQQQPYNYSSNPFSWPPSDSSLHPPGTDPTANYTVNLPNSTLYDASAYGPQSADSQNWIANYDTANVPLTHEALTVSSSFPSTWNDAWPQQYFATNATAMLPNQTKVAKSMRCEVCKINCNSNDVYEKHILGKKHKKNAQMQANPTNTILSRLSQASVQSQTSSTQGEVFIDPVTLGNIESESNKGKPLKSGKPADSAKVCEVCNIICNSQEVYNKHLYGKKHAAQVRLMSNNGIGPYIAAFKRQGVGPWQKAAKKIKVAQPAWCDVCKVNCNSSDIYISHLAGKKHLKNLEKLSQPRIEAGASAGATAANASQLAAKPMIGPQEKPGTDKPKPKNDLEIDIEAKKRKVVEGGVAAAAVKLCSLCNVVCNSEVVFNDHLSGHKHAAMVKKQGGAASG